MEDSQMEINQPEETPEPQVSPEEEGTPGEEEPAKKKVEKQARERLCNLPISRIKQIMKLDPDVTITSSEAAYLITKAAEMFIENLAQDAYKHTVSAKKKTVQKRDIDSAISSAETLEFLEGMMET